VMEGVECGMTRGGGQADKAQGRVEQAPTLVEHPITLRRRRRRRQRGAINARSTGSRRRP
jgi:hypothetical protein